MAAETRWSIAVFTSREGTRELQRTLQAVMAACASTVCTIDVLVDGNPDVATAIAAWEPHAALPATSTMRLWLLPWRDKACTWNRYLHDLAPEASVAFFVDGYIRPAPGSLAALAGALGARAHAWAASGVPTVGPSATSQRRRLLVEGGLHGNLYALRGDFVRRLRARGFRLPLGLYRNDSLVGAVASFAADPAANSWDPTRTAVVAEATWDNDLQPVFSRRRVRAYLARRERQAQGRLENAAVRQHLAERRLPPETLPRTVEALVQSVASRSLGGVGLVDRYLMKRAARRLVAGQDWSRCDLPPRLLRTWNWH